MVRSPMVSKPPAGLMSGTKTSARDPILICHSEGKLPMTETGGDHRCTLA